MLIINSLLLLQCMLSYVLCHLFDVIAPTDLVTTRAYFAFCIWSWIASSCSIIYGTSNFDVSISSLSAKLTVAKVLLLDCLILTSLIDFTPASSEYQNTGSFTFLATSKFTSLVKFGYLPELSSSFTAACLQPYKRALIVYWVLTVLPYVCSVSLIQHVNRF